MSKSPKWNLLCAFTNTCETIVRKRECCTISTIGPICWKIRIWSPIPPSRGELVIWSSVGIEPLVVLRSKSVHVTPEQRNPFMYNRTQTSKPKANQVVRSQDSGARAKRKRENPVRTLGWPSANFENFPFCASSRRIDFFELRIVASFDSNVCPKCLTAYNFQSLSAAKTLGEVGSRCGAGFAMIA